MQQSNRKTATLVSAFALLATVSYYELADSGLRSNSSFITQQNHDGDLTSVGFTDGYCDPDLRSTNPEAFLADEDCAPDDCKAITDIVNGNLVIVARDCWGNGNSVAPKICTDRVGTAILNDGLAKCCNSNSECGGKNRCLPNSNYLMCK